MSNPCAARRVCTGYHLNETVQTHVTFIPQGPLHAPDEAPEVAYVVSLCNPIVQLIDVHIRGTTLPCSTYPCPGQTLCHFSLWFLVLQ